MSSPNNHPLIPQHPFLKEYHRYEVRPSRPRSQRSRSPPRKSITQTSKIYLKKAIHKTTCGHFNSHYSNTYSDIGEPEEKPTPKVKIDTNVDNRISIANTISSVNQTRTPECDRLPRFPRPKEWKEYEKELGLLRKSPTININGDLEYSFRGAVRSNTTPIQTLRGGADTLKNMRSNTFSGVGLRGRNQNDHGSGPYELPADHPKYIINQDGTVSPIRVSGDVPYPEGIFELDAKPPRPPKIPLSVKAPSLPNFRSAYLNSPVKAPPSHFNSMAVEVDTREEKEVVPDIEDILSDYSFVENLQNMHLVGEPSPDNDTYKIPLATEQQKRFSGNPITPIELASTPSPKRHEQRMSSNPTEGSPHSSEEKYSKSSKKNGRCQIKTHHHHHHFCEKHQKYHSRKSGKDRKSSDANNSSNEVSPPRSGEKRSSHQNGKKKSGEKIRESHAIHRLSRRSASDGSLSDKYYGTKENDDWETIDLQRIRDVLYAYKGLGNDYMDDDHDLERYYRVVEYKPDYVILR